MKGLLQKLIARTILISAPQPTVWEKIKYAWDVVLHLTPIAICLDLANWWFSENRQFGIFMSIALMFNLIVGVIYHLKRGTFNFKNFLLKNIEMIGVVVVVYFMLEMLRYTAGNNFAGEAFRIFIQMLTLLYPTSKVFKNIFILTKGKYPPKFLMLKLYNFEKNGDLSEFFKTKKNEETTTNIDNLHS
ncbi:hypothetical protein [Sphingobacterium thalpophilum]|uniref:hypothetical protein n=1 Tax=Sphingobacterium thalpophilum TaxID=259 RepID=UPI0024A79DB4|nr:hypothetical protein [Sphingobacterium thalpophilum]